MDSAPQEQPNTPILAQKSLQTTLQTNLSLLIKKHAYVTRLQKLLIQTELKRRNVQQLEKHLEIKTKHIKNLETKISNTTTVLQLRQENLENEISENNCEKFDILNEKRELLNFHKYEKVPIYRACISRQRQLLNDLYAIFPVNSGRNLILGSNVPELVFVLIFC